MAYMESTLQTMVEQAKEKFKAHLNPTSERLDSLTKTAKKDDWYWDALKHLFAELVLAHKLLELAYTRKDLSIGFSKTAELAWRSRNILEVDVWIKYSLSDRTRAYKFYSDMKRDFIDWIAAFQHLLEVATRLETLPEELDKRQFKYWAQELGGSKQRIKSGGQQRGLADADMDESYTQVSKAAKELGKVDYEVFIRINKILSKFAHPTAFTLLLFPNTELAERFSDIMYVLGLGMAAETLEMFEAHLAANGSNQD
jgi:hypothetical protein